MANTINGYSGSGATSIGTPRTAKQSSRDTSVATTLDPQSEGGDQEVQITSTASQLASLGSKLSGLPAVDEGRVAQISQSLANGTYTISADKIASGLMQSDRALAAIGLQ